MDIMCQGSIFELHNTLLNSRVAVTEFCLCTCYIVEDHTGENLKKSLLEILDGWSLDQGKQVAITTDCGSNIKLACRLLGWTKIDLAILKGLQVPCIEEVLKVYHRLLPSFLRAGKKSCDLVVCQADNNHPVHKLKTNCTTK